MNRSRIFSETKKASHLLQYTCNRDERLTSCAVPLYFMNQIHTLKRYWWNHLISFPADNGRDSVYAYYLTSPCFISKSSGSCSKGSSKSYIYCFSPTNSSLKSVKISTNPYLCILLFTDYSVLNTIKIALPNQNVK